MYVYVSDFYVNTIYRYLYDSGTTYSYDFLIIFIYDLLFMKSTQNQYVSV